MVRRHASPPPPPPPPPPPFITPLPHPLVSPARFRVTDTVSGALPSQSIASPPELVVLPVNQQPAPPRAQTLRRYIIYVIAARVAEQKEGEGGARESV